MQAAVLAMQAAAPVKKTAGQVTAAGLLGRQTVERETAAGVPVMQAAHSIWMD